MNIGKSIIAITTLYIMPFLASAAPPGTFKAIIDIPLKWIAQLIPIAIGIALLVFLWGIGQFILNSGNSEELHYGKQKMFYGVIGLFVIISIWGLVALLGASFGIPVNN